MSVHQQAIVLELLPTSHFWAGSVKATYDRMTAAYLCGVLPSHIYEPMAEIILGLEGNP